MHCVTSVVFMQSVSDYAATSCTTRNKFHDLRSMAAKVKSACEPGCWFRHFLLGTMMTTATSILMINTNVTIIMQLWHLARAGSVSNTGLGSCCKHDFKQFFSNMINFENFWTVTPVSYCHCHWSKHGLIIIVVPDWYWDFLDRQCLTIPLPSS